MPRKHAVYSTLEGRSVDLSRLSPDERACLRAVIKKYKTRPGWTPFANWCFNELSRRGISKESPVFIVCGDLEGRIGIAQGKTLPGDYRYQLVDLIEERYGTRYRFCKENGIDQGHLSRILSGRSDFSLESLKKVLLSLRVSLVLLKDEDVRETADLDGATWALEAAASLEPSLK